MPEYYVNMQDIVRSSWYVVRFVRFQITMFMLCMLPSIFSYMCSSMHSPELQ